MDRRADEVTRQARIDRSTLFVLQFGCSPNALNHRTMPTPFLSSEEYDERAHQLYNEGQFEDALEVLREGLTVYPNAVDLHIGVGYARLAREEFAWARRAFTSALVLDSEHEDALAGLGEVLMRFGEVDAAKRTFQKTLDLGFDEDLELMLQIGRALFREGHVDDALRYFETARRTAPDSADVLAMIGYTQHRRGDDADAVATLKDALRLDADHAEARIYLANLLYDRGDYQAALYHLDQTEPDDHWDELGIWRLLELKRTIHKLPDSHPSVARWETRLADLASDPDATDELLADIEQRANEDEEQRARHQLELFGSLLNNLATQRVDATEHRILLRDGRAFHGTWEEIVTQMKEGSAAHSVREYMQHEARRGYSLTGVVIPVADPESFIRGSADAGLLRILK